MFGFFKKSKRVAITKFKRGGEASVASHCEGNFTKKEVLKMVGEWWDGYGIRFNDYDGIQLIMKKGNEL